MFNVFLIKSPLQLLNAIEAKNQFRLKSESCILILLGDRKSQNQLFHMANANDWHKVIVLDRLKKPELALTDHIANPKNKYTSNKIFSILKLKKLALVLNKIKYAFIGDYANELMRHFINSLHCEKIILLDDGNATIKYANQRNSGTDNKNQQKTEKLIKFWMKRKLLGLRDDPPESVTYFTIYDLQVKPGDELILNEFNYLRTLQNIGENSSDVYFLGSPLVEAEILNAEEYFWHLKQVKKYFENEKLVYISHRREHQEKLNHILAMIGIPVRHFDYPIEHQIAILGPKPKALASFYSSALENCRVIFGSELDIISFKLDPEHFAKRNSSKGQIVKNVYTYYEINESESFRIISLPKSNKQTSADKVKERNSQ